MTSGLDSVDFESIVYEQKTSFRDLFGFSSEKKEDSLDKLLNILESSNKASIQVHRASSKAVI